MTPFIPPPSDDSPNSGQGKSPPPEDADELAQDFEDEAEDGDDREEEPSAEAAQPLDELVTVGTFPSPYEAEIAKAQLEEAGIAAFIADAETVSMNWLYRNAVGYVKLQVAGPNAQAAAAILADHEHLPDKSPAAETEEAEDICLACNARIPQGQSSCPACGWSYEGDADA
jgi:ribosomal protein L40E